MVHLRRHIFGYLHVENMFAFLWSQQQRWAPSGSFICESSGVVNGQTWLWADDEETLAVPKLFKTGCGVEYLSVSIRISYIYTHTHIREYIYNIFILPLLEYTRDFSRNPPRAGVF